MNKIEIKRIDYDFTVCKVTDYSLVNWNTEYCFIGKTEDENSLVCFTRDVPQNVIKRDDGWKVFRIQEVFYQEYPVFLQKNQFQFLQFRLLIQIIYL